MGVFRSMTGFGGRDMAVDLGTANTLVYVRGRGIVLSEPSVVAIDQRTGEVHAVGTDAQRMIGRTPATISADRPLRHGVIADFEVTEAMLRQFVGKVMHSRFSRPRMVICAPSRCRPAHVAARCPALSPTATSASTRECAISAAATSRRSSSVLTSPLHSRRATPSREVTVIGLPTRQP